MNKFFCGISGRRKILQLRSACSISAVKGIDAILELQADLSSLYSRSARPHGISASAVALTSGTKERLMNQSSADLRKLVKFAALHPDHGPDACAAVLDNMEQSTRKKLETVVTTTSRRSRATLDTFISQSHVSRVLNDFVDVDLLVRRESRSQLTLLLDMHDANIDPKMDAFYLGAVDSVICRSEFRHVHSFQESLSFPNLAQSIINDRPISVSCSNCGSSSTFLLKDVKGRITCTNAACSDSSPFFDCSPHHLHPGGNRVYFGPSVPNLANVWIGRVDKFVHKNSRAGILTATVFKLCSDSSNRKKIPLPAPDPRVQWTILPFPR